MHDPGKRTFRDVIASIVVLIASIGICFVDLHPVENVNTGTKVRARVLEADNSGLTTLGLVQTGSQLLRVKILNGEYRGKVFRANNQLRAQLELDKMFKPGDIALVAIFKGADPDKDVINAQDHYRIGWTVLLIGLFSVLLVAFGGMTGLKSLLSFVFSCLVVWKLLVPWCLDGFNPMLVSFVTVAILSAVIIYLVAGLNRKGTAAFLGAIAGVFTSCLMAWLFTTLFKINGAIMPYSQSLLYSGYETLNLADIYIGGIFLSSSGAVMDLGMDISAGMTEVVIQNPKISRRELIFSGIRIGRSVVGTMTTTLLLAYSGGYLTLMMMFAAQGTSPVDFINNPYVASEMVKTIVGSFGLVLVAPLTALIGGVILRKRNDTNAVTDR